MSPWYIISASLRYRGPCRRPSNEGQWNSLHLDRAPSLDPFLKAQNSILRNRLRKSLIRNCVIYHRLTVSNAEQVAFIWSTTYCNPVNRRRQVESPMRTTLYRTEICCALCYCFQIDRKDRRSGPRQNPGDIKKAAAAGKLGALPCEPGPAAHSISLWKGQTGHRWLNVLVNVEPLVPPNQAQRFQKDWIGDVIALVLHAYCSLSKWGRSVPLQATALTCYSLVALIIPSGWMMTTVGWVLSFVTL